MTTQPTYEVIIIGGSYSGLAAAMALGRALRSVLVIDSGRPCNAQTPYSHNFLTQDGQSPSAIAALGKEQVKAYPGVKFQHAEVTQVRQAAVGFEAQTAEGESFRASWLLLATGIRDLLPGIDGLAACWGISVLHCPFCHGYEVRNKKTGIIGNGTQAYELATLLSNWTRDLSIFTNGPATFTAQQASKLAEHRISIVEKTVAKLDHTGGRLQRVVLHDGSSVKLTAAYTRSPFRQSSPLPEQLGCALSEEGYIVVDAVQATSVPGIYACGDNSSRNRTVANAVAAGTTAGIALSRQLIAGRF